jgi:ATP-binding cassette subfamily B protein
VHSSLLQFLGTMMTALVLYGAGTLVLDQELSIGAALSVQLLAALASQPLQSIAPIYNEFLNVRVSWRRLSEPFAETIFPNERDLSASTTPAGAGATFDHVDFTYPGTTRPVLRDVSFTLEPHKVTALVGYTGAGKSSIAKLLVRTYDPDQGSVNIGGADLRHIRVDDFRPLLGIVPQDPFVFQGTVSSNIRYAKPDATAAEVEEAVRSVGAWPLLSVLPQGLEHRVEEEGRNLTAAQRQLVALARAWIAKPDILLLDEATSLLDSVAEDTIIDAIHRLGCTTLMITHRESVAARADFIVVLEAGQVVDNGPEADVARPGGPYDRLWRIQEDELAEERDRQLSIANTAGATPLT